MKSNFDKYLDGLSSTILAFDLNSFSSKVIVLP